MITERKYHGKHAIKTREVLKMKIHKYCQFERTSNLETLLKENETLELLDEYDSDGNLPVHVCAENGSIECLKMICFSDRPQHISARNLKGLAPLHIASFYGYLKIMKLLVIMGEDVNVLSRELMTPLHIAASRGNESACRWLLSNNADTAVYDAYGRSALDSARRYKNGECVKVILNYQVSKKTLRKQRSSCSLNDLNTLPNTTFCISPLNSADDFGPQCRRSSYQGQFQKSKQVRRLSYQSNNQRKEHQLYQTVYEDIAEESIEDAPSIIEDFDGYGRQGSYSTSEIITSDSISIELDLEQEENKRKNYRRWESDPSPRLSMQSKQPLHKILQAMKNYFRRKDSDTSIKSSDSNITPTLHKSLSYNSVRE
ncbi:hypothetical protein ACHWQZ_G018629 [Mnemiopsis leidyi]